MRSDTKTALHDCLWTALTCGLYFIVIFMRVLFTTKAGQQLVEEKIDSKIKAKIIADDIK